MSIISARAKRQRAKAREAVERNALRTIDTTRCHAWTVDGVRCALDIGHYRSNIEPNPCPHVAEDGTEWFGSGRNVVARADVTSSP